MMRGGAQLVGGPIPPHTSEIVAKRKRQQTKTYHFDTMDSLTTSRLIAPYLFTS